MISTEKQLSPLDKYYIEWVEIAFYVANYIANDIDSKSSVLKEGSKQTAKEFAEEYMKKIYSVCDSFYFDLEKEIYVATRKVN